MTVVPKVTIPSDELYAYFDSIGVPRNTDGDFSKSPIKATSEGMVTFGTTVTQGYLDVPVSDFSSLTGRKPLSIQYIFCLGASDITDLITNTTGVLVGVGLYYLLKKIFKEKTNKIILALAAIVTILFVSLIIIILINN